MLLHVLCNLGLKMKLVPETMLEEQVLKPHHPSAVHTPLPSLLPSLSIPPPSSAHQSLGKKAAFNGSLEEYLINGNEILEKVFIPFFKIHALGKSSLNTQCLTEKWGWFSSPYVVLGTQSRWTNSLAAGNVQRP